MAVAHQRDGTQDARTIIAGLADGCRLCAPAEQKGMGNVHCPGPNHSRGDRHPSLTVTPQADRVLLNCKGGCDQQQVLAALQARGIWPPEAGRPHPKRRHAGGPTRRPLKETPYSIRDAEGVVRAVHVRREYPDGKSFIWRLPDGSMGLGGCSSADLPLYGVERLRGRPGEPVVICEGERATVQLSKLGVLAVGTVTGASGTPSAEALRPLAGREVYLWPDADPPGDAHMARIGARLAELGIVAKVIRWADAGPGGDAADLVAAGGTRAAVDALLAAAAPWEPSEASAAEPAEADEADEADDDDGEDAAAATPDNQLALAVASVPPLPPEAALSPELEAAALAVRAVWLDRYIDVARQLSPRTSPSLHELCGLFALFLAIARRAYVQLGAKRVYPVLFTVFVGRSTLVAKSTGLEVLTLLLDKAGLGHLLLPSSFTPQALLNELALGAPQSLQGAPAGDQERWLERHRHGAQRGIVRDEVAGLLDDVSRDYNTGLLPLLLKMESAPDRLEGDVTISRGHIEPINVGVSVLGVTTPAALREHAAKVAHWTNGLFARFLFVAPDEEPTYAFWRREVMGLPPELVYLLGEIYTALPQPTIEFVRGEQAERDGKREKGQQILRGRQMNYSPAEVAMTGAAWDLYGRYDRALFDIAAEGDTPERLDATYGRLPGAALRVAIALACADWALSDDARRPDAPVLDVGHWAAAQRIVERWRVNVHLILAGALRGEASEAYAKKADRLVRNLEQAGGSLKRGEAIRRLNWSADVLSEVVAASGGRVRERAEQTGGRPAAWLDLVAAARPPARLTVLRPSDDGPEDLEEGLL